MERGRCSKADISISPMPRFDEFDAPGMGIVCLERERRSRAYSNAMTMIMGSLDFTLTKRLLSVHEEAKVSSLLCGTWDNGYRQPSRTSIPS